MYRTLEISAHHARLPQVWGSLAEANCIPLPLWKEVLRAAAGRLEDSSVLVQRNALQLMNHMMLHNPFGASLDVEHFLASLKKFEEKLKVRRAQTLGIIGEHVRVHLADNFLPA